MQYLSIALPLAALVGSSFANPVNGACTSNACIAAVTGKAALGDGALRASHCASFLATTVTPEAITVTETITGDGNAGVWRRASVTVCPNEVPNYASACDEAAYTSACSCFGFTKVKTTTIAPTTTTKTVFVKPTGATVVSGTTCPAAGTVTKTIGYGSGTAWSGAATTTVTATVYVTAPGTTSHTVSKYSTTTSAAASTCVVDDAKATILVTNFMDLLQHTSYNGTQGPPGQGYDQAVSDATLSPTFSDISDSINFMAGVPLGSVSFASKQAFDIGQGHNQPEVTISALNIWHDCNSVTWRWRLFAPIPNALPVTGINYMIINNDGLIEKNYAEFDNGAWLQSFGKNCSINPVSVSSSPPALKARGAARLLY